MRHTPVLRGGGFKEGCLVKKGGLVLIAFKDEIFSTVKCFIFNCNYRKESFHFFKESWISKEVV